MHHNLEKKRDKLICYCCCFSAKILVLLLIFVNKRKKGRRSCGNKSEGRARNPHSVISNGKLLFSHRNRTAGRRGRQNAWVWQVTRLLLVCFGLTWSSLDINFFFQSFTKKDLFKRRWSLAEGFLKQNYCHACHTLRFAVFFPLPSCCVRQFTQRTPSVRWKYNSSTV